MCVHPCNGRIISRMEREIRNKIHCHIQTQLLLRAKSMEFNWHKSHLQGDHYWPFLWCGQSCNVLHEVSIYCIQTHTYTPHTHTHIPHTRDRKITRGISFGSILPTIKLHWCWNTLCKDRKIRAHDLVRHWKPSVRSLQLQTYPCHWSWSIQKALHYWKKITSQWWVLYWAITNGLLHHNESMRTISSEKWRSHTIHSAW